MEIRTQLPLTPSQIKDELKCIVAWLAENDFATLELTYGFGCEDADSQYEPVPVATEDLLNVIDRAEEAGFFEYGRSDLWIASQARNGDVAKTELCLCHESDVHFASPDLAFVERIKARWLTRGWTVHQGTGEAGCAWTSFP
jgi:hypothetical protein